MPGPVRSFQMTWEEVAASSAVVVAVVDALHPPQAVQYFRTSEVAASAVAVVDALRPPQAVQYFRTSEVAASAVVDALRQLG
jgi:hypothetical protein